jgi:hypothetical protein
VTGLPDKIVGLHRAMAARDLPHAFGGALALAWCTQRARATIDIDLNVFVHEDRAADVVDAMPPGVRRTARDVVTMQHDGQARLWWGDTPVDIFLSTTEFHDAAAGRVHREPFAGQELPFLGCTDLAVFKAFFGRTRDWADLEDMAAAGTLNRERVLTILGQHLDADDDRLDRLRALR